MTLPPTSYSAIAEPPYFPPLSSVALHFATSQIIVLMLNNPQRERGVVLDLIRAEEKVGGLDNAYIVFFFSPSSGGQEVNGGHLPTKALLNAVGDLCQTRLVYIPNGKDYSS